MRFRFHSKVRIKAQNCSGLLGSSCNKKSVFAQIKQLFFLQLTSSAEISAMVLDFATTCHHGSILDETLLVRNDSIHA